MDLIAHMPVVAKGGIHPMKIGLYARVSTKDQSCTIQLAELKQYCLARGWNEYTEYVDAGISGKSTKGRKEFERLMKDAITRRIDTVIVTKLDRFSRSVPDLVSNIKQLDSSGVRFIAMNQGIDTDQNNPTSRLLLNILGCVAEFERDLINERTAQGLAAYRKDFENGKARSKSGKNLSIGGQKAVFDRLKAIEMRQAGKSYREIARELNVGLGTVVRTCSKNVSEKVA
jgi:DNA invertase Pin-like site-specific DNA recombinase